MQRFNEISHGNIFLSNMVLMNEELKLSGFKPVYCEENSLYVSWWTELARNYGH